jgi:putative lipoprotein
VAAPKPPTLDALRGPWRCTAILGAPVTGDGAPTIDFREGGRAGGFAGVNRYGCEATSASPGALHLGAIAATRMAGPPERMELEGSFLAALQRVTGARMSGQTLELTSEGGTVLRFERATAPARQ